MSRDTGVKKGGAKAALDALNARPKGRTALNDGFVGTAGREQRGDDHVVESHSAQNNEREHDEGTALTREDVIRLLREQNMENALIPLPPKPGWHRCWLSTTNPRDTPAMRERLGYRPVDPNSIRGFDEAKIHSGEYAGRVMVNEMVAYEVPEDIYQAIMKYSHHDKPNEEAGRITDSIEEIEQTVGRKNVKHATDEDDDGIDAIREEMDRRAPIFQ